MLSRLIMIAMFVFLSPYAFASGNLPSSAVEGALVGKPAPEFTLETTAGVQQSLSQAQAGQRAILFFWATWCPHCHEALESISLHLNDIKLKGARVLLVNSGENKAEAKEYLMSHQLPLVSFLDEDNTIAGQYGVIGIPTLFFIDEKGIIRSILHEFPSDYEAEFTK